MFSCRECMSIVQQIAPYLLEEGHRFLFFASVSADSWICCPVCIGWVTFLVTFCNILEVMCLLYYLCSTHQLFGFQFGRLSSEWMCSWNSSLMSPVSSLYDLFQRMRIRWRRLPCIVPIVQRSLELPLLAKIDYYGWLTFPLVSIKSEFLPNPSLRWILVCVGVCLS